MHVPRLFLITSFPNKYYTQLKIAMASELVKSATCEKLLEIDWTKNIEICETVAQDNRQAKDVIKAIKKRLGSKSPDVLLYSVSLLEMLMNNIGEPIHKEVMDAGLLSILVKIVKKKSDFPVREKIFLLLDATQTSVGGAKGRFPQYYNAYYELVSAGVQFPQPRYTVSSNAASPGTRQINLTVREVANANQDRVPPPEEPKPQAVPESSIIQKATAALEVLREVLDAVDLKNPEAGKDEFTLDLVEQCSFQKQRVMHLVMTSRNERLISQAIELNEQLGRVLTRHDALLAGKPSTMSNHIDHNILAANNGMRSARPAPTTNHIVNHDDEDEDEAEQLSRRIRKGKARVRQEEEEEEVEDDEGGDGERPFRRLGATMPTEKLNRPLIRPLSMDSQGPAHEQSRPQPPSPPALTIPPPPSKHTEREKFFQEKKGDSAGSLSGHMRGLSLHRRNPSSSYSGGSFDSNE